MKTKKYFEEILKFGLKNDKNRQKIIFSCISIISIINSFSNKRLSKKELGEVAAGAIWSPPMRNLVNPWRAMTKKDARLLLALGVFTIGGLVYTYIESQKKEKDFPFNL